MSYSMQIAESTPPSSVLLNTEKSRHNVVDIQQAFRSSNARGMLEWLVRQPEKFVLSTSFGPYSPVLLHMLSEVSPSTPVIWVDTGYNTASTYRFIESLKEQLDLNLHVYHPLRSVAHREAVGKVSKPEYNEYENFKDEVKLEPFRRALEEHEPGYWVTGIRREECERRKSLCDVSPGPSGIVKLAPLFDWNEAGLARYMNANDLQAESDYFDPTKLEPEQKCG